MLGGKGYQFYVELSVSKPIFLQHCSIVVRGGQKQVVVAVVILTVVKLPQHVIVARHGGLRVPAWRPLGTLREHTSLPRMAVLLGVLEVPGTPHPQLRPTSEKLSKETWRRRTRM